MNPTESSSSTRFKVGVFTIAGLGLIGVTTVFVNDRPYWWRPCQIVHINVEDATGLKTKSPIRSLGLEIGYLKSVDLSETHVDLGICITAPVEVLPSTRAYIRSEGFLGDKFVELKPVKYIGPAQQPEKMEKSSRGSSKLNWILEWGIASAWAEDPPVPAAVSTEPERKAPRTKHGERQIPVGEGSQDVQHLVNRVDSLVNEMTSLTTNLKEALNPEEVRQTMRQLNKTLENASRTLAPEGGLNQTAQRTLAKLEDAIDQLRDQLTRINQGEGSLGMILNDPKYAEELHEAIKNVNRLLSKVGGVRFLVDVGGEKIRGYNGGRGWFRMGIWPKPDRYYLVGISLDPRGRRTETFTETEVVGTGLATNTHTVQTEQTGILFTAMLGKIFFNRLDLSVGALNGDGAISAGFWLGPLDREQFAEFRTDVYTRGDNPIDTRFAVTVRPYSGLYVKAGLESIHQVNGVMPLSYAAGVSFEDEDIKLLFALR